MSSSDSRQSEHSDELQYYVYQERLITKALAFVGWLVGWVAYCLVRSGWTDKAEELIDNAIMMRRANPGAIRAIGLINGRRGLPALRRGRLIVHGKIHGHGPFANKGFFATYDVAAPSKMRALTLIRRFEWDALPESLEIEEGELEFPDSGAEGVLWIAPGRIFYSNDP